jgi:hypothetical protein
MARLSFSRRRRSVAVFGALWIGRDAFSSDAAAATLVLTSGLLDEAEPHAHDQVVVADRHALFCVVAAMPLPPVLDGPEPFAFALSELPRHCGKRVRLDASDLDDGEQRAVGVQQDLTLADFFQRFAAELVLVFQSPAVAVFSPARTNALRRSRIAPGVPRPNALSPSTRGHTGRS